ncbi:hypothetical protein LZ24_03402 [Desulfobotulus alkaliphilus]|uniref:YD repeat-containing protein n=1 Tax=Desulfobotulus alkaliphilus TaxID=622671 RepID=A0A562QZC1_9BACT|nr:hypothetical protein LZ24_03402 [Desulfobotulus alkaliphilus]
MYEYDTLGNLVATGLDVDENGILEENSEDRITATATRFVKLGADWWEQSETRIYNLKSRSFLYLRRLFSSKGFEDSFLKLG